MTDTGPAVRLRISTKRGDPTFDAQVALIKKSGAEYDGATKTWSLHLTPAVLAGPALDILFQAAREYSTYVTVDH